MKSTLSTLLLLLQYSFSFILSPPSRLYRQKVTFLHVTKPSKVVDEDGPTPSLPDDEPTLVDPATLPELEYNEDSHPIPHQPWRRGSTQGCEDPIEAPWRQEAETIIKKAANMVNGKVLDVTWYLTTVVIAVDDESLPHVEEYTSGPEIMVEQFDDGPQYFDPEDPNPEPIWADEEEFLYERDDETEDNLRKNKFVGGEIENVEAENPVKLYAQQETRDDMAAPSEIEEALVENQEVAVDCDIFELDTMALSTMARAILQALENVEDDLHVLERHEVQLTSLGDANFLETQSQFDAHEGKPVIVETQDPFGSNRTLKGTLLLRNSMDVVINKRGRMVTIPHNFIKAVRIPGVENEEEDEEE